MRTVTQRLSRIVQISAVLVLAGCGGGGEFQDIRQFMDEVNAKPKGRIAPLPEFQQYTAFTYGASDRRSPFEPPVVVPPMTDERKRNIGVKPPQDHIKQYLENFNLAALSMVGTLEQTDGTWALILDANGRVTRVQQGDYMGTNWGQIDSISANQIDITEIVSDGAGGWLRRPRSLQLRGGEE